MKIAIATKNRPFDQHTLKTIYRSFRKEEVFLFIEPGEIEEYRKYEKIANLVSIEKNGQGLRYARNFIYNYFKDEIVFNLDDDIIEFREREKRNSKGYYKLRKMDEKNIRSMFVYIHNFLSKNKEYGQATISFSGSNWLFNGLRKENTRVHVFKCNNNSVLHKAGIKIETGNYLFEDYDFTLDILSRGLKNISFYLWAFNSVPMGTNKGGCQEYRLKKLSDSIKFMKKKWGNEIVKEFYSKKHNLNEIKISWKKAINSKI